MGQGGHEHSYALAEVFSDVGDFVVDVERCKTVDKSFNLHPPSIRSKLIH